MRFVLKMFPLGKYLIRYVSFLVTVFTLAGVAVICRPPMLTGSSKFDTNMLVHLNLESRIGLRDQLLKNILLISGADRKWTCLCKHDVHQYRHVCNYAFPVIMLSINVILLRSSLILRYLRGIHFALLTVSYAFFGTLECAVFGIFSGELSLSLELRHWILCIGLIFFTFLAQISLIAR